MIIALLAVPILVQTAFIAVLSYWLNWQCRVRQDIAAPSTLIGTSNFFELAVGVAIVLYGLDSGAALATVVGVLIEVPVMLVLVRLINAHREHYRRRGGA
jgi:ACR3 family arsenite transporter